MKESYLISNLILLIIYTILSIAFFSDLVKETDISYVLNKEIKKGNVFPCMVILALSSFGLSSIPTP